MLIKEIELLLRSRFYNMLTGLGKLKGNEEEEEEEEFFLLKAAKNKIKVYD